jgi:Na+/H+ antiporter NhaC
MCDKGLQRHSLCSYIGCVSSLDSISSWVGFEVGLLNTELEKITEYCEANGLELTIKDSGFAIFLQSIKYRYYPIFMLVMMMFLIFSQRDFGTMLLAERRVRVYDRTDGGPNKGKIGDLEGAGENQPKEDQPLLAYNMLLPVLILVGLILFCLIRSGDDGSGTQTFMEKIESSDSFIALLYGVSHPGDCFSSFPGKLQHVYIFCFLLFKPSNYRPWVQLGL